ncbi:MAG: hypothetical protein HYS13_14015, partial [Planctomycetia bacterium]|nr:hypothetical protein [Planctomycetia bacterium]
MKKSETAIREIACAALAALLFAFAAQGDDTVVTLKGTQPLTVEGDLSAAMRAGFDKFLSRELDESVAERAAFWKRDFSSAAAYNASVAANRERFRRMIGLVDERAPIKDLELLGTLGSPAKIAEDRFHVIYAVRWPVLEGVFGEGLLLEPKQGIQPVAHVVALPDADQTPEMLVGLIRGVDPKSQFAVRLAEGGCRVVIPALIDRRDTYSGNPRIAMTNQPHREWIYRQSYTMGRHVIGYEVHKVLAL